MFTNDLEYAVYLLLKDGNYFKQQQETEFVPAIDVTVEVESDVEMWFQNL